MQHAKRADPAKDSAGSGSSAAPSSVTCRGLHRAHGDAFAALSTTSGGGVIGDRYIFELFARPTLPESKRFDSYDHLVNEKPELMERCLAEATRLQNIHGRLYKGDGDCITSVFHVANAGDPETGLCFACQLLLGPRERSTFRRVSRSEAAPIETHPKTNNSFMTIAQKDAKLERLATERKVDTKRAKRHEESAARKLRAAEQRGELALKEALGALHSLQIKEADDAACSVNQLAGLQTAACDLETAARDLARLQEDAAMMRGLQVRAELEAAQLRCELQKALRDSAMLAIRNESLQDVTSRTAASLAAVGISPCPLAVLFPEMLVS